RTRDLSVRDVADDNVAERILGLVGDCAALLTTNELLASERAQARLDLLATCMSGCVQRAGPEDLAQDRCILQDALLLYREQIEPCGDDALHRLGQIAIRRAALGGHAHELFRVEGITAGACE